MSTATFERETATRRTSGLGNRRRRSKRRTTVVPVIVGALATIALAVAVGSSVVTGNAASGDAARLEAEFHALQSQLAGTGRTLAQTDRRLAATNRSLTAARGQLASYRTQLRTLQDAADTRSLWQAVSGVQGTVHKLARCVPQLEQRVARLGLRTTTVNGWLRGASLVSAAAVTNDCAP
jgi:septal ring factor EnvC (AmiA/AmiB activator)